MKSPLTHKQQEPDLLPIESPMALFWQLSALATGLTVVVTWLALVGLMVGGYLRWQAWLFVAAPIVAWLIVLALPVLWHSRRGAIAVVAALAKTAEAWLARAGYSIDLNQDGAIGWADDPLTIERPEIVRPVLVSSRADGFSGVKMLPHDANTPFGDAELEPSVGVQTPPPARAWSLPNGITLPQPLLEKFVDGVFVRGWSRGAWVGAGKDLEREQYDGAVQLLEQAGILTGRKPGAAGRLTVHTAAAARAILRLSPTPPTGQSQAQSWQPTSQVEPARPGPARASQVNPEGQR